MQRMSAADFRKEYKVTGGFVDARAKKQNGTKNTRKAGALCEDDGKTEVRRQTIQALRDLQGHSPPEFFDSPIRLSIDIVSGSPADGSNILKAIEDALQGYAFRNDKQVRNGTFRFCDSGDRGHMNANTPYYRELAQYYRENRFFREYVDFLTKKISTEQIPIKDLEGAVKLAAIFQAKPELWEQQQIRALQIEQELKRNAERNQIRSTGTNDKKYQILSGPIKNI